MTGGHDFCSVLEPVQFAPPIAGSGLSQSRERVLLPLLEGQFDHEFHPIERAQMRKQR